MPTDSWYGERVSENLRREILWVIANETNDPRIPRTVSIPSVKLAKDNRNATVFVSVFPQESQESQQNEAVSALNKAAGFIQSSVAKRVKIKHFPKLFFKLDKSFEYRENVDALLEKVKDDLSE